MGKIDIETGRSPREIRRERSQTRAASIAAIKVAEQAVLAYHKDFGGISAAGQLPDVDVKRDEIRRIKDISLYLTRGEVGLAPVGMKSVLADLGIGRRDSPFVTVRLSEEADSASQFQAFCLILQPNATSEGRPWVTFRMGDVDKLDPQAQADKAEMLNAGHSWLQQVFDRRRGFVEQGLVFGVGK